ncbi:energy transducer TonB [Paludibacterium paludis]|uniref:TonB C-terminal domain-containing protein n=1 Tax=Paludibacterium paludis TaxID=1225769 RepID=A0A918U859_9NEIS|nr:energy transducer TonB [Paludibacterium paludis]GGY08539.1 hypothetical protein GCM10011289_09130 [Paludibacterium paludis]
MVPLRPAFRPPALLTALLLSLFAHGIILSAWPAGRSPAPAVSSSLTLTLAGPEPQTAAPRALMPPRAPAQRMAAGRPGSSKAPAKPAPVVGPPAQSGARAEVVVPQPKERSGATGGAAGTDGAAAMAGQGGGQAGVLVDDRPADYRPEYLRNPVPEYPWRSREQGEEGRVVVRAEVDAVGKVRSVRLERSSGFGRLDKAALDAVSSWRFVPATRGGVARESEVLVPVPFRLR